MPSIRVRENDSLESALKRFKKECGKEGILSDVKKREHYEKPSIRRKKKEIAARKNAAKRLKMSGRPRR